MKTLTIGERHEMYKLALVKIESDREQFICIALRNLIDINLSCVQTNNLFPELLSRKPKEIRLPVSPWFHGESQKQNRIELLKECILETTPKKSKKRK